MGLFDRIFKPKERQEAGNTFQTLTAYSPVFTSWDGAIYESALVRAAIDARARHISKLKVELNGTAQPTLRNKLKARPNEFQTWSQFLYRTSTILDCHNTAFIVPIYDAKLNTVGFYPVLPTNVTLTEHKGVIWLKYQFSNGNIAAVELKKCALLTKFQHRDDFFGATNDALTETMQLMHIQSEGIKEAVKSSATYRFMAQAANFSKTEDLKNERQRFDSENFKGEGGGILLFPNTYKDIKQILSKPYTVDSAQMELIRTNVYNYFGVSEDILQNRQNSAFGDTWSSFYEGAIEPFAIQFSEAMTGAVFSEREIANGSLLMATSNRLQYMTNSDKLNVASQLIDRGVISINDARDIFNLPPVDGGDIRTIRGEYKNADDVGEEDSND